MLKRNAIMRILLIGILASVFLLMLSGTARADVVWEIDQDVIDTDNFFWWADEEGKTYTGTYKGISWEATITKSDVGTVGDGNSATDDVPGEVSFRITNITSSTKEITIPDKISIPSNVFTNWHEYSYKIVKLSSNVFTNCSGATSIKIGKYVSSIPTNAFEKCTSLTTITVASGNSNFSAADGVLYNSNKTTLVKYPIAKSTANFNIPTTVTKIGDYAFSNNTTTGATIKLPTYVTSIGSYAFYNFKGLESIEIPAAVASIGSYAFSGCSSLEKINLPQAVTSLPTGIFKNCTALNEVVLGDKVTSIGMNAFYGDSQLSYIKLPSTLTTIYSNAFEKCTSLKTIEIPDSVTTVGYAAFAGCTSLTKATLPKNLSTIAGSLFSGCTSLTDVNIPTNITSIGSYAFYNTKISRVEVPETVKEINASAFRNCPNLVSVVVPSSLTTVGTSIFDGANSNLVVYATENNKAISLAPAYIIYEKGTDSVKLKSFIDVKGNVTEIDLLNKIYGLPVTVIGASAFKDNTKLTKVTIPDTVTTIEAEAFSGCTGLTEMILPKALKTIGDNAFYNCTGLKTIIVQKGTPIESIGTDAFKNCNATIYHDGTNAKLGELAATNSNVKVDDVAPTATLGWALASNREYATITIENISDVGSGAYKYAISTTETAEGLKDTEWKSIGDLTKIAAQVKTNGNKYIYIMDKVGNVWKTAQFISGVDVTAPSISAEIEITGSTSGAQIKVVVADEAGGSELASYLISQIQPSEVEKVTTGWEKISGREATVTDVISNTGTWYLYVKDNAGNIGNKQIVIDSTYIDKVAPSITIKTKEPQLNEQNKIAYEILNATLTDEGIGLAGYAIDTKESVDTATNWVAIAGSPKTYEVKENIEVNGTYYIHAKDVYGNVEHLKFETIQIEGDFIVPRVDFGTKADDDTVEVTLYDANSGLATGANIGYAWGTSNTESPADEAYSTATISYKNADKKASFKVDGNSLTGTYYLWIKVGTLKDVAGNESKVGKVTSGAYTFDNTLPTIKETTVTKETVKENGTVTYTITTSEEVTLDSEVKPYVTNDKFVQDANLGTLGEITGSGTTWTVTFTAGKSEGPVVLVLPKGLFKDSVGNLLEETKITKVKVDNTEFEFDLTPIPSEDAISTATNGVYINKKYIQNGAEAIYTFKTSEKLTIVEAKKASVTLTGEGITGTVKDIRETVDGNTWTFTVIGGEGNGKVTLNLPKGLFIDEAGNESNEQIILGLSFDNTAPTVSIEGPKPTIINKDATAVYTITASEGVELANVNGITVSNAQVEVAKKSEDGTTWEVKVSNATGDGEAKLIIAEGTFKDEADNVSALTEKAGLTIDNTAPNIISVSEPTYSDDKASASIVITTEKKEAKYVVSANESVENVTEEWKTASSATMTAKVESNGEFYVYVVDEAGNITKYPEAIEVTEIIDNIAPTITIEAPKPSRIKTGETATFRIITSEAVTIAEGFEATVTGEGNTVELTGSKTNWLATVTAGSEDGEVELVLPKGIFKDTSDNSSLEEVTKAGLTIDNEAPEATVKCEQTENGIKVIITANEGLSELEGWTLTKTNKDNDTLVKEITDNLSEVTIKDIAGNEAKVETKVKFATAISLNESATVDVDQTKSLAATITPADATPESIKWTSSNTSIVTVDGNGKIKGISKGTAKVTATSIKDASITATCQVIVNEKIEVESVTFDDDISREMSLGHFWDLSYSVSIKPDNASVKDVEWSSNNTSVIIINENGQAQAVGVGDAVVTVTADGGKTATLTISVEAIDSTEVTGIELDETLVRLVKGQTAWLNETVKPEELASSLQSVVWASSNEKVATVVNGLITAVGKGEATITVTTINGGKSATCKVYVEESNVTLTGIAFEKATTQIVEGYSETLKVKFTPSNAINQNVTFTSSDETVATVDENGKVVALVPGNTTITATAEEGGYTATCEVTVTERIPVEKIELDLTTVDLYTGDSKTLVATVLPETATDKTLEWSSSNEKVATVNKNGKITAVGAGNATITVMSKSDGIIAECEVKVTEFIEVENVTLSQTDVDIMKNSDIILVATINPSNATNKKVTWSSNNEKIAKVEPTEEGYAKVTGVGDGIATITVTSEDGNKTATCKVKVTTGTQKVTGVTLDTKEMTLPIGKTSKLTVTVNPADAANKTVTWKSSNEEVITVDANGNITAIAEGTAIITVTAEDGNFSANCSITVVKQAVGFTEDATFGMQTIDGVQYLVGINPKNAIQSILDKVAEGYTATVQNANGAEITDFTKYASTDNTRIIITNGTETIKYIVVVKGDCTGDGLVTSLDLIGAVRQYKYVKTDGEKGKGLEGAKLLAIKFTESEKYTALDLIGEVRMYKQWKNK